MSIATRAETEALHIIEPPGMAGIDDDQFVSWIERILSPCLIKLGYGDLTMQPFITPDGDLKLGFAADDVTAERIRMALYS